MSCSVCVVLTFLSLLLAADAEAHPQMVYVIPVQNPTHAEEFHCISESSPETSVYNWFRQNSDTLPEGVKAEGNILHFMKSDPDLNGAYICRVVNELGEAAGTLYRYRNASDRRRSEL